MNLEALLNDNKKFIINQAMEFSNNAYKMYYRGHPEAERYNLCLAMSSKYAKAGLLLARLAEVTHQEFPSYECFFSFLQRETGLVLSSRLIGHEHLTARLDGNFDSIFREKMQELESS
jgi:hypothetical protein